MSEMEAMSPSCLATHEYWMCCLPHHPENPHAHYYIARSS